MTVQGALSLHGFPLSTCAVPICFTWNSFLHPAPVFVKPITVLVNSGLVFVSLAVSVLLLEGGIRLGTPLFAPNLQQALVGRAADEDLFQFEPGLGMMAKPNLNRPNIRINDTEIITIQTDSTGFRNPVTPTTLDIAFLGDSFVWGFGVERSETWVESVGKLTRRETASYGQSGFSSWQYAQVFDRYIAPRKPRLVIWSFFANDLDPVRDRVLTAQAAVSFQELRFWLDSNSLVYRLLKFIIQGAYFSDQQPISYRDSDVDFVLFPLTHNFLSPQDPNYQPGLTQLQDGIRHVQQQCKTLDCQLVVVLIPTKEMVYLPRVQKAFTPEQKQLVTGAFTTYRQVDAFLTQQGVRHYDLTPDFQKAAQKGPQLYFRIDGHWNAQGHQVAAQILERYLNKTP
jgi:lysophospholipase L1-like esterase